MSRKVINTMNERQRQKTERLNREQLHRLVEIVDGNRRLDPDPGSAITKLETRNQWSAVAFELNDLGPSKSWEQWRQAWRDLRFKVRKKRADLANIKRSGSKTYRKLDDLELRILRITEDRRRDRNIASVTRQSTVQVSPEKPSNEEATNHEDESCWDLPHSPRFSGSEDAVFDDEPASPEASETWSSRASPKRSSFHEVPRMLESGNEVLAAGFNNIAAGLESVASALETSGSRLADALNNIADAIRSRQGGIQPVHSVIANLIDQVDEKAQM